MKNNVFLLFLMALLVSCHDSSKTIRPYNISSIDAVYPDNSSMNYRTEFKYDNQNRLIHMKNIFEGQTLHGYLDYTDNKVTTYTIDQGSMKIEGKMYYNENKFIKRTVDEYSMNGTIMTGKNNFEYQSGRISQISTVTENPVAQREPMKLKATWTDNNLTTMVSDWANFNDSDEACRATIHKTYDKEHQNFTSLDINILLELFFQDKTILSYLPLITGSCGKMSENLMSKYEDKLEMKINTTRNLSASFCFQYQKNNDNSINSVNIQYPDGKIYAQLYFTYE